MALFEFKLHPLEKVMAWGNTLHWFGLTDGIYYMNVGEEQLFRNSKEKLQEWKTEDPSFDTSNVFVDYQVIRLYEDLLEILPNILQEVPLKLYALVETPQKQEKWQTHLWNIYESTESKHIEELYFQAAWLSNHQLSTMHLQHSPNIWFWRVNDEIFIRWDNRLKDNNIIQPWSTVQGEIKMSVKDFLFEVKTFHNRLINCMTNRIELIQHNNPIPNIEIDIPYLMNEHKEREKSLENTLKVKPDILDWDKVISANKELVPWF